MPVFAEDVLRQLLKTCSGKGFAERRNKAIIRFLLDTGTRRAEAAGMHVDDLLLDMQEARVVGKGRRERRVAYGAKTVEAIDTYMRARINHPDSKLPNLWLSDSPHHGTPFGADGIRQMLNRRARKSWSPAR